MNRTVSLRRFALGLVLGAIAGIALLVIAAHGGTTKKAPVMLGNTALGSVLVDARGRTLYAFDKDRKGTSTCEAACATYWPPLVARTTPHGSNGVHQSLLGHIRRRDGRRQVTYAGHPLYTFVGDKAPGQTTGQRLTNFGAEWYVLAASGHTVERSTPTSDGYGGYASGGGY
jgi:predicted lipoprotein with Yx(FWY)xxD motif